MFDRKKLDRERMEYVLVYGFLARRAWFAFSGLCALLIALALAPKLPGAALLLAAASLPLLALGQSYRAAVLTARFLTWLFNP